MEKFKPLEAALPQKFWASMGEESKMVGKNTVLRMRFSIVENVCISSDIVLFTSSLPYRKR